MPWFHHSNTSVKYKNIERDVSSYKLIVPIYIL